MTTTRAKPTTGWASQEYIHPVEEHNPVSKGQNDQTCDQTGPAHQEDDRTSTDHSNFHQESDKRISDFRNEDPSIEPINDYAGDVSKVMHILADKETSKSKKAEWQNAIETYENGTVTDTNKSCRYFGIRKSKIQKQIERISEAFKYASTLPDWQNQNTQAAAAVTDQMMPKHITKYGNREAVDAHLTTQSCLHYMADRNNHYSEKDAAKDISARYTQCATRSRRSRNHHSSIADNPNRPNDEPGYIAGLIRLLAFPY